MRTVLPSSLSSPLLLSLVISVILSSILGSSTLRRSCGMTNSWTQDIAGVTLSWSEGGWLPSLPPLTLRKVSLWQEDVGRNVVLVPEGIRQTAGRQLFLRRLGALLARIRVHIALGGPVIFGSAVRGRAVVGGNVGAFLGRVSAKSNMSAVAGGSAARGSAMGRTAMGASTLCKS